MAGAGTLLGLGTMFTAERTDAGVDAMQ